MKQLKDITNRRSFLISSAAVPVTKFKFIEKLSDLFWQRSRTFHLRARFANRDARAKYDGRTRIRA